MPRRFFKYLYKGQKGITGLETAIILIAFVVVASVFAYTVLSAGLFSTQKSQQAVYSGLKEAQSSLEVKGSVVVEGVGILNDCDTAWDNGVNITAAAEATVKVEGDNSASFSADSAISAAQTIGSVTFTEARDISSNKYIYFWIRSSANITGDATEYLTLTILDATANTATTTSTLGALSANTWTKITWDISAVAAANKNAVTGLRLSAAGTAVTIAQNDVVYLDIIETEPVQDTSYAMTAYGNKVIFTVALPQGTEGVDFTTTSDADHDGIISDESTKNHKVVISYSDQYQTINDIAWSKTAIGYENGNTNILDAKEKFQITVDLANVNNNGTTAAMKVSTNHTFRLDIKTPNGATLVLQRTMPSKITTINNVN